MTTVTGTSGNDTITSTSGDDRINTGNGADTIIYQVETNAGSEDSYNGGADADTLIIRMMLSTWESSSTWMLIAFEALRNHLATHSTAEPFYFSNYAPAGSNLFDLRIHNIELVKIQIGNGSEVTLSQFLDNLAPDAVNDEVTIPGNETGSTGNVIDNDSDPDGLQSNLTVVAVNDAAGNVGTLIQGLHGDLMLNADGSYTYTLTDLSGDSLIDTFTYKIFDGINGTDTATLTITIEADVGDYTNTIAHFSFTFNPDGSLTITDQIEGPGNEGSITYDPIPSFLEFAGVSFSSIVQAPISGSGTVAETTNDNEILVGLPRTPGPNEPESILRARNNDVALIGTAGDDRLVSNTGNTGVQIVGGRGDDTIITRSGIGTETILYAHMLVDFEVGQLLSSVPTSSTVPIVIQYVGGDDGFNEGRDIIAATGGLPHSIFNFDGHSFTLDQLILQAEPDSAVTGTEITKEIFGFAGNAILNAGAGTHVLLVGGPDDILNGSSDGTSIAGFFPSIANFSFGFNPDNSLTLTDQVAGHAGYSGTNILTGIHNFNFHDDHYTSITQALASSIDMPQVSNSPNEILVALPQVVGAGVFASSLQAAHNHVALIGTDGMDKLVANPGVLGAVLVGGEGDDVLSDETADQGTIFSYARSLDDYQIGPEITGNVISAILRTLSVKYMGSDTAFDEGHDHLRHDILPPPPDPGDLNPLAFFKLSMDGLVLTTDDIGIFALTGNVVGDNNTKYILSIGGDSQIITAGLSPHILLFGGGGDTLNGNDISGVINDTATAGFFSDLSRFSFELTGGTIVATQSLGGPSLDPTFLNNIHLFNFSGVEYSNMVFDTAATDDGQIVVVSPASGSIIDVASLALNYQNLAITGSGTTGGIQLDASAITQSIVLIGGRGADVINTGSGGGTLAGGAGADSFIFSHLPATGLAAPDTLIEDFFARNPFSDPSQFDTLVFTGDFSASGATNTLEHVSGEPGAHTSSFVYDTDNFDLYFDTTGAAYTGTVADNTLLKIANFSFVTLQAADIILV